MKLLSDFDVNLTSFPGEMNNDVWNVEFVPFPDDEVRSTSKFVMSFSLRGSLK